MLERRARDARDRRGRRRRPCPSEPTCGSSPFRTSTVSAGSSATALAPALGDQLELAVAVELVAEEVAEADGTRPDAPQHLRQRRLVDLEEAELGAAGREEGGGDARRRGSRRSGCARAGSAGAGSRRPSRRSSSCRSSRRSTAAPGGQPGGEPVDRARVELREELARHGHSGAGADEARERGDTARGANLDGQTHAREGTRQAGYLVRVNRARAVLTLPGEVSRPGSGLRSPCFTCICGPCASAHGH